VCSTRFNEEGVADLLVVELFIGLSHTIGLGTDIYI
jgi:hypothetical protein